MIEEFATQYKAIEDPDTDYFNKLCRQVFVNTKEGREILEILKKAYLIKYPVCSPEHDSCWGYFREGQNNIIRYLEFAANQIKT